MTYIKKKNLQSFGMTTTERVWLCSFIQLRYCCITQRLTQHVTQMYTVWTNQTKPDFACHSYVQPTICKMQCSSIYIRPQSPSSPGEFVGSIEALSYLAPEPYLRPRTQLYSILFRQLYTSSNEYKLGQFFFTGSRLPSIIQSITYC